MKYYDLHLYIMIGLGWLCMAKSVIWPFGHKPLSFYHLGVSYLREKEKFHSIFSLIKAQILASLKLYSGYNTIYLHLLCTNY